MDKFRDIIATLIIDSKWTWLETLIDNLCELEMKLCTAVRKLPVNFGKIPQGLYCYTNGETCPYWGYSRIARLFYGDQLSGYCFYLNQGDFNSDTFILWDQCKCCGINDEEDFDEGDTVECNLEL